MMTGPIIPLLIAIIAGIAIGGSFQIPFRYSMHVLALSIALTLVTFRLRSSLYLTSVILVFFLLGMFGISGLDYRPIPANHIVHRVAMGKLTGEGVICDAPIYRIENTILVVDIRRIKSGVIYQSAAGRVQLTVPGGQKWEYGDYVRFQVALRHPVNFHNPGQFDKERRLRRQGILLTGFIPDATGIVVLRKTQGNDPRLYLERLRTGIRKVLEDRLPGEECRIIQAMILGERQGIPEETYDKFNVTGTTHIIAISGLHIGIVAFFGILLTRSILFRFEYCLLAWDVNSIAAIVAMVTATLYMGIAGMGISVIRATLMIFVFTVSILVGRRRDLYHTLALAAMIILLITPTALFDVSFQLSFSAVLAILFFTPKLNALFQKNTFSSPIWDEKSRWWERMIKGFLRMMVNGTIVSLSATLGTFPLILYHFNRLSLISLPANFIVVPLLGMVATPVFLLSVLSMPISDVMTGGLLTLAGMLVKVSLFIIDRFASIPYAATFVTTPTKMEVAAYYILLACTGLGLDYWRFRNSPRPERRYVRYLCCVTGIVILFLIVYQGIQHYFSERNEKVLSITAVDVGQGSATLVRLPGGKRMLIDGGGSYDGQFDMGRSVLAPYLWKERINRIDTVILTHPHPDHLQGLLYIIEHFKVSEVWTNGDFSTSPFIAKFLQILRAKEIQLRCLSANDLLPERSGVRFQVLNPPSNAWFRGCKNRDKLCSEKDINERSLVLKISYGSRRILVTGDISAIVENDLVRRSKDLRSDVLFVPHHGSNGSSSESFLRHVQPLIGIISCGRMNIHGLPHTEILNRLKNHHVNVYRTDLDGAITMETDGQGLSVSTYYAQGDEALSDAL